MGKGKHRWALLIVLAVALIGAGCPTVTPATAVREIEILSHSMVIQENAVVVQGVAKNVGKTNYGDVPIEVKFYDRQGNLIDVARDYLFGGLEPGETWKFGVRVYWIDPEEVGSYTVEVG